MKKFLIITFLTILLATLFTVAVSAEDTPVYKQPEISISSDSVDDFVTYTVAYDSILNDNIITITAGTFGICIYDDPETLYIDGIRLNGETVSSLSFPIDLTKTNKITVRTVYKDDITGDIAQIADGTYDYTKLLQNPITILMAAYYIISILSVFISICTVAFGKKKKVKTSNEIASTVDAHAKEAFDNLKSGFLTEVSTVLEPFFKTMSVTQESIVEAIVLMNSKEGSSHLQALECLKKVSATDVQNVIDTVRTELQKTIHAQKTHKENTIDGLKLIAETAQEESADVNNTPPVL